MGNNQHLKRHTTSKSYPIKRKNITFITKPNPGSFKKDYVVPIVVAIRDILNFAKTLKEVKEIIFRTEEVLINGKKVKDVKNPLGLFDILEFKKSKKKYLLVFNKTRKIYFKRS